MLGVIYENRKLQIGLGSVSNKDQAYRTIGNIMGFMKKPKSNYELLLKYTF